jgi:WS/DGAT/MGAT family acyltransferase
LRQLTSLDAQFLALETSRQTGHVGGLAILDPSTTPTGKLELVDLHNLMEERLPLLPPFRWRLVEVPFGLDYPYWVDDQEFDLEYHVRELALAPPGDKKQLSEQVARIMARPLDRARPLWELYLIYGLPEGFVAMLTKIHHSVIDGLSGAEIMGVLLDLAPEAREVEVPVDAPPGEQQPGDLEMLGRGLLGVPRYPLRLLRSLPSALPNLDETAFSTLPGADTVARLSERLGRTVRREGEVVERMNLKPPRTSFNARISPHRRFVFGQLSLDDIKTVKNEYGYTVNDVIVSMCAGAVRRWLVEHEELPADPLVAQIPISVRAEHEAGTYGNRIVLMHAPLFTNIEDPVARLHKTHEALRTMKERHRALPADLLKDVNHFVPPAVFSRAARATFALSTSAPGRPSWNLVISNVPGPQFPLYCAGARLEANYPVSVITDGMGLNITVMSYCGHCDFGIVADRDQMPDVWNLIDWLGDALEELMPAQEPRSEARVEDS